MVCLQAPHSAFCLPGIPNLNVLPVPDFPNNSPLISLFFMLSVPFSQSTVEKLKESASVVNYLNTPPKSTRILKWVYGVNLLDPKKRFSVELSHLWEWFLIEECPFPGPGIRGQGCQLVETRPHGSLRYSVKCGGSARHTITAPPSLKQFSSNWALGNTCNSSN